MASNLIVTYYLYSISSEWFSTWVIRKSKKIYSKLTTIQTPAKVMFEIQKHFLKGHAHFISRTDGTLNSLYENVKSFASIFGQRLQYFPTDNVFGLAAPPLQTTTFDLCFNTAAAEHFRCRSCCPVKFKSTRSTGAAILWECPCLLRFPKSLSSLVQIDRDRLTNPFFHSIWAVNFR